ncbi:MAG TPA: TldD/PmbA family protein [Proteobacteria bacterium]|nr:TldD/PmbA family protein [Pseudomonadota bacterium]
MRTIVDTSFLFLAIACPLSMIINMIKMLKFPLADLVFDMEKKVPSASALAMETEGEKVTVETHEQKAEPLPPQRGVVFTVFTGRHFMEAATNDLRPEMLKKTAQDLVKKAEDLIRYDGPVIDPGEMTDQEFYVQRQIKNEDVPLAQKIDLCRSCKNRLEQADKRVTSALCQYLFVRTRELFVNRHKKLYQDLKRTQAVAFVVMCNGERAAELHTGHAYQGGYEHAAIAEDKLDKLIADCASILFAERLNPGYYDCIFSPAFAGMFAHEAFGHGMETDMFLKHRAKGAEYINKHVASPLVNMFDSPALPGQAASFFFDHEGQPASETQIIENGILKSGLTDLNSALRLNIRRTANGRRESFSNKIYARMTNTYFGPGKNSLEEMLKDISFGYLLEHPSNGMEDPKGWGIQLEGYYAAEIRDGQLTGKVYSPVIVTGSVPELLGSITMVGDKIEISGLGMCGKGHKEWVKVTDGGPYVRLKARLG